MLSYAASSSEGPPRSGDPRGIGRAAVPVFVLDPPARGLSPPAAAATAPAATTPEPAQADRPEISVIITAYRRRQFLSEALHSVVRQSMEPGQVEVVLVKDFADPSTDAEIAASPVTVRTVTEDLPLGEALARAIEMSRGRLLCFLDDDDRFVPGKLTEVLRYFSQNPSAGFLRNSFRAIDAEGRPLSGFGKTRPQPPNSRTIGPGPGDPRALAWIYHYSAHINLSSMTVRAELARPALPWLRRLTGGSDIFWFFVALTASSDLGIESRPWTEYRIHASSSHASIDPAGQDRELRRSASRTSRPPTCSPRCILAGARASWPEDSSSPIGSKPASPRS